MQRLLACRSHNLINTLAFLYLFKLVLRLNWRIYLKPLQIAETPKDLTLPKNVSTEKLNSIFHIDTTPENLSIRHRGAVCPFILNDKEDVFNNFFEITYNDWISKTFKYLHDNCDSNEIQLIALEFSAACDFSQNKIRTNKYILGVLFPSACFGGSQTCVCEPELVHYDWRQLCVNRLAEVSGQDEHGY